MNFFRRRKTMFAGAAMFGIMWTAVSGLFSVFSDGGSFHWTSGVFIAAFLIMFGLLIGPPEERCRRRELRREAKWGMRRRA